MTSLKHAAQRLENPGGRPLANPFCGSSLCDLRCLIVALMMALAGCATLDRSPHPTASAAISESTWEQIDRDIGAASLAAKGPAENLARGFMERWRDLVAERNEADFIPWFTGYWTQQWLSIKVAWYKLGSGDEKDQAANRLAAYLQEQYHERVLQPVAREIDPDVVRTQATKLYVQLLDEQLRGIPRRHGVPPDQFEQRIRNIPAIELAPPPAHDVSLYQIVRADPLASLPAYKALMARIRKDAGGTGDGPSAATISPVARQASEKLLSRLAISGGASAASAAVGGVAGLVISLGAAGFGVIAHESERPEMEAQLRESLSTALDDMWNNLMEDPATGVMAGVYYISGQVEGSLPQAATQPVESEPLPQETPLLDEINDDEAIADDGNADE